jgi:outer membrane protein TolC
VQAAKRELAAAGERVLLEQARSHLDVTPFVGYKRLATDNSLSFGVTVPLKTRDRNEAGISRAETDQKMAQTQVQAVRNRVLAEVEMAYEAFQTARQQVQTFRNELLNQADESRSIALTAYQRDVRLLPVLKTTHGPCP